ncbi:DUF2274 domain-containing protein [Xanthobacter aminoxidans]|uniref:DUF2274 domain-containing protein n=1 Tax=Xanthobacter aminoxidans TaxID=186280 RepID=UPI0020230771|nr:DUF2274 domain-containing protein [Xanthobacter aminoxidans]MCL8384783.1 DUF2274 domain-containing protein [Xanthobacter aminoxidans]
MPKLKLSEILDEKPVKVTVELPAKLHRDLVAYSEILSRENNQSPTEPSRLIVPMLERFIATDRGFAKARRAAPPDLADEQSLGSLPRREPSSGQG